MFENIINFFKKLGKKDTKVVSHSKEAAKERLHLVLMQDRANVSADFLELMKQEIIDVIKKYIDVDESAIDVRLTNKENSDGTNGAPALYANIPILNIKNESRKMVENKEKVETENKEEKQIEKIEESKVKDNKKENKTSDEEKVQIQEKKDLEKDNKSEKKEENKGDNIENTEENKKEEPIKESNIENNKTNEKEEINSEN